MKFAKHTSALAVAVLLAACGGGSEPEALTPQMAGAKLQASARKPLAQAPQSVTAEQAAEMIFEYAQQQLDYLFPAASASATLTAGPFRYRYYAGTGLYLGVVVDADPLYTQYNVYVLGGVFGFDLLNPFNAGPLTQYVNVTIGSGGNNGGNNGGGGTGNGCFDLALAETQSTVIDVSYSYSGTITGTTRVVTTVGALTTFEGQSARATQVETTGSAATVNLTASGHSYSLREGDNMRHFGSQFNSTVQGMNMTIKSVYSPAYLDTTYTLSQGQSVTLKQTGTAYTTITGLPIGPQQSAIDNTFTHTYEGRETITALGKSMETCRYTVTTPTSNVTTTTWYALPKGIPVKIFSNTTPTAQTIEATSATINGTPL